ncbi:hypothetical protein POM88_030540 [Heracleum sosnowskyi]|uniref:DUF4283 domain-containing protein n=1 Tax=Heracleum sosnowskyi TaxID=360622 RepID=A0AAD8HVP5_9APIA|nr:hypothetical protein POM88_030540 [Heracleum sosnowskyi]
MGSQDSNVNSDGVPVDQDGTSLEYGGFGTDLPFAVAGDVFQEIMREQPLVEELQHIEANPVDDEGVGSERVRPSALSAIPVVVSDGEGSTDGEDFRFEDDRARIERDTVGRVMKAAFAVNKEERSELIALREMMMEVQSYLKRNGLSMADCEKEAHNDRVRFNGSIPSSAQFFVGRDEFGLPIFKSYETRKAEGETYLAEEAQLEGKATKSWVNVIKSNPPKHKKVNFNYCPLPSGIDVVEPPEEVLLKGAEKFKCCIVGHFTKGLSPVHRVQSIAKVAWGKKGLLEGTWYFDKRPLVVSNWSSAGGENVISELPVWFKLSNIPDCYWTEEGLGRLTSVLGQPLCADKLTSQFNLLPCARMCVQYKIGDPLPDRIKAVDFNSITREKSIVEVLVSYQQKPKVCSGCKSLGHLVSVCPTSIRKWFAKDLGQQNANDTHEATAKQTIEQTDDSNIANVEVITESDIEENTTVVEDMSQSEGWTTVISKWSKFSGLSPGLGSPFPDESPPLQILSRI